LKNDDDDDKKSKGEVKGDGGGKATKKRKGTGELKNDDDYAEKPKKKSKHDLTEGAKMYDIGGDELVPVSNLDQCIYVLIFTSPPLSYFGSLLVF
jgi:hypothetical protein